MNISLFVTLFAAFSTLTGLFAQGIKKLLDETKINYSSNFVAIVVALILGSGGTAVYYILNDIIFNAANITYIILMGFATALGAMVGYDKVTQTIEQFKNK